MIVALAESEMRRAKFGADDIEVMRQILTLFFDQWDSGGAVWVMAPVLQRCIAGKCLTPLTGADDEWEDVGALSNGEPMRQNIRCSTVFSDGSGRCYDIDTPGRPTITFPYWPACANVSSPVIEISKP